jgi:hypothetical protein
VSQPAAPLDLAAGSALVLDGAEWMVERLEPQHGRVLLVDSGGNRLPVNIRSLVNDPRCRD